MPIASDIWIEAIRPKEAPSLVAAFDLSDQPNDDPARLAQSFAMAVEGFGDVRFDFVACIKGRAIYSASLKGPEHGQGQPPERAELLCRELLRAPL